MKRIAAAALLSLSFAAVACSSSSTPTGTTAAQACADQAKARCTRLQACSPTDVQVRYGDEPTCETREAQSCTSALAAPQNGNNPTHVESCSQAYAGWACADFLNNTSVPLSCQQQTGSIANGAACNVAGQCQSGFCATAPGSACGVCAAGPKAGDSCAALTTCGPGLVCTIDTQTCVALGGNGSACGKGAPCGAGFSCVGADAATGTQGTCQAAVATSGAPCDPTQKTAAGCDRNAGLTCNTTTKQCAAIVIAAGGQACGFVNNQNGICGAEGICTATPGKAGTCTAAAADGAACDTANGPACVLPARCIGTGGGTSGTCQFGTAATCH